jgi:GTP-binding protein HflX
LAEKDINMTHSTQHSGPQHLERVLLVIVDHKKEQDGWPVEDIGHELKELIEDCRGEVVQTVYSRIDKITASYYIGAGKAQEIAALCAALTVDTVVFSQDLKGSQQRNLEEVIKAKTIDRTQLILDIFARHATSREGKMQVELAQLEYMLPRLVGSGIALSRLGGGIGTLGPGETKLEMDRRRIQTRITKLKRDLEAVTQDRALKRKKRKERGLPSLSLVGYTNAGKSTLLNTLTQAGQLTRDGLFTTLDSLSRQLTLPNRQTLILSDTVGFMHDLPHHLIEAFKTTLEEVVQADILIHVLDISHTSYRKLYDAVDEVLKELKAHEKPVITVLNKVDCIEDSSWVQEVQYLFQNPVVLSAKSGEGIPLLMTKLTEMLAELFEEVDLILPINRMDLINLAHQEGQVYSIKYYNDTIFLRAALPARLAGKFRKESLEDKERKEGV